MKTAAINFSLKLLILTSFIVSANFAMASGDIVECQPVYSQIEELSKPARLFAPKLQQRLSCARVNHFISEPSQKNLDALCNDYATCDKKLDPSKAHDLLAKFVTKKRLEQELPRSMIYSAVKKFLEKENAFPAHVMKNGKINYRCATDEYTIDGSIAYKKSAEMPVHCRKEIFNKAGMDFYNKCGQNKNCFGDLDIVLGDSRLINGKENNSRDIEGFIQKNTLKLAEYYQSKNTDEYVEEIRLALLENKDINSVLKKYRDRSPVLMAMFMSSEDFATRNMLDHLNPILAKEVANLKKANTTNPTDFKAAFKKFQIAAGQGMFSNCSTKDTYFPFNPSEICSYGGRIANGNLKALKVDEYSDSELIKLYRDLEADLADSGNLTHKENAIDMVCKTKSYAKQQNSDSDKGSFGAKGVGSSVSRAGDIDSGRYGESESSSSDYSANAAMDHEQDIAVINKAAADFGKSESGDENAVIQANNQNLRGQNNIDSQAFINNFQPIDNYSGLTNEYVNKSYINRADKLKADKETSTNSDSSLNKQYSDIEAKIAEAEARLKELQQGFGEVGKNAKNQPVVSNGVGKEKTQTSSEMEELLKEIKELKAQNNEIKEKLVAKASSEKAEKAAEKNPAGSFSNSPGLAFSSGNKNDYKYESKPVEIKPTSSYSSSAGSAQAMRAPSSLGAAKLGSQSSGAILSAVDSKADAVNPARAVTRVDSFNSESARKAITSRINEINKNTKEMEQNKATIEIDGQLKEVISFEVLDEKGKKKLVVVELKDGKIVLDKDGNPIYVSQDMTDDSIIITKKGKDEKTVKKLQSQADVKRVDELKLQKGRSAERVKLNDLTRSAVKEKP